VHDIPEDGKEVWAVIEPDRPEHEPAPRDLPRASGSRGASPPQPRQNQV
jgi:hypothetical protein